ncbi:hypothetical protein AAH994_14200 [Weeksellaceae bacterium A-14]|uniref:hypothetical protein n=1 Tax=Daejeonia sp. YH14 TaxID=3439042 RepID=UPI0031E4B908
MALKKIFFPVFLYIITAHGCQKLPNYRLFTRFNPTNNTSTLILSKNNIELDSINNIGSYYGKDSIVFKGNNLWDYYYHGRCGTGCSNVYYMRVVENKEKINIVLNILSEYKEYDHANGQTLQEKYSFNGKNIQKRIKINGVTKEIFVEKVRLDRTNNIFYNTFFVNNDKKYYGIKIDSLNYLYLDKNKWKSYIPITGSIEDLK